MKPIFLILPALGLSALLASAFDVPRGIHDMTALEEARAKAAERPEPVSFVITRKSLKET